jgi:tetratricopeptide (TPR) repeat protein
MISRHLQFAAISLFLASAVCAQNSPRDAQELEHSGKLAEAAQVWRNVVKGNPKDAAAWASLGVDLSRLQHYQEAAEAYRKALALSPKLPGIQLNLGLAEFKSNNLPAAIPPLRAALATDPKSTQARTLLGLSCYGTGRFSEAAKHLAIALAADPSNAELHNVLAQSCLSAKQYHCALNEFSWILKRTPDSAAAHMLLGEALDGLGKTPEAIQEFQLAVKADPKAPDLHFGLGYLFWKLRRYDEAAQAFEAELSLDPENAQALAYLGDTEMHQGSPETALPLLQKATRLRDDLRVAYVDIGAILTQQKQYQDALTALRRAETLDPQQPDVHYRLGRLYQILGDTENAKRELAKVQQLQQRAEASIADKMSSHAASLEKQP